MLHVVLTIKNRLKQQKCSILDADIRAVRTGSISAAIMVSE